MFTSYVLIGLETYISYHVLKNNNHMKTLMLEWYSMRKIKEIDKTDFIVTFD